jgi:hypothetical protein
VLYNRCTNNLRSDGFCEIKAGNDVFGDSCPGTFKYLRVCTYCEVLVEEGKYQRDIAEKASYPSFLSANCPSFLSRSPFLLNPFLEDPSAKIKYWLTKLLEQTSKFNIQIYRPIIMSSATK